jgi:hypothetical protein
MSKFAVFGIAAFLILLFSVPLGMILYGGGAAALGGLAIIGALIVCQLPMFLLLKWCGWIPPVDRAVADCHTK